MHPELQSLLSAYHPEDLKEQSYKERFMALLAHEPRCFERDCFVPGHITASAWVLNHSGDKALLLHHRKLDSWFQPGGHCDGDPKVLNVALKEAWEETGLENLVPAMTGIFDLDIHLIPPLGQEPAHEHFDLCFLLRCTHEAPLIGNHESKGLAWFPPTPQALPEPHASLLRMLSKWQALLKDPSDPLHLRQASTATI